MKNIPVTDIHRNSNTQMPYVGINRNYNIVNIVMYANIGITHAGF